MDCDEEDNSGVLRLPTNDEYRAVNSSILEYYKKFGRKRDLEQYFSLSTAQSDIRDTSFWSRMKTENESSDSGERSDKKSESSHELCRISIRFPAQDPCTSQEEDSKTKTPSVSPPIIIEELPQDSRQNSEDEALKSDDNNSQKSYDVLLDTSINKLHSPSSSITSQRKLEWDSLADVGYANESDRKTSASSLSTLERLALKQQYSNNDTQQNSNLGIPTAHSTPLDEDETKAKSKKGGKKSTKIYKKDVDVVEVNVPHSSNMTPINVNLTKHISFNVEKDGKVSVDNIQKDITPEKISVETEMSPRMRMDKEMQTSLTKASNASSNFSENVQPMSQSQKIPILISLNTLRSRVRRNKLRMARRRLKKKRKADKENIQIQEKSGEQLSAAESFEYMPGHIYNQNQLTANDGPSNAPDNKSSLESSAGLTTDSSKGSKHSFAKDLEKSIDLLKTALQQNCDDSALRKQLIKQVCQRLLKSKYRDDDSTTDFLSGLSFSSKKLGLGEPNNTTTSTSDANNSAETPKRPKKSILRTDKFNPGPIASTSQSVPNLPVASNSEKLVTSNLAKNLSSSNTESDVSSKERTSSDNGFVKTSSEELYRKYLQALKREEAYKKHLKDKEMFLKQKLVSSDSINKAAVRVEMKPSNRLKDLMNDLTRNNYDDGSGDASKLEGGPGSHRDLTRFLPNRTQRSHSVFTLSSGNSDSQSKKPNAKKSLQCGVKDLSKPGPSKDSHYCCCPHHSGAFKVTDSSVQVNIKNPCSVKLSPAEHQKLGSPRKQKNSPDSPTSNVKYVCLCNKKVLELPPDDFKVYKLQVANKDVQVEDSSENVNNEVNLKRNGQTSNKRINQNVPSTSKDICNKSSQTNMLIKMLQEQSVRNENINTNVEQLFPPQSTSSIYEATRWIQTEISIDPKISEPTLSDINIVSDTNCAKLVDEQRKELSKPSLTSVFSCQVARSSASPTSSSCKSSGSSKESKSVVNKNGDAALYDTIGKDKTENSGDRKTNTGLTENFTIPIQGTNMTLMVSIGSECRVCSKKKSEEMVPECIGTDKVMGVEQATCLTDECSKGVQFGIINDNTLLFNTEAKMDTQSRIGDFGWSKIQGPSTNNCHLSNENLQLIKKKCSFPCGREDYKNVECKSSHDNKQNTGDAISTQTDNQLFDQKNMMDNRGNLFMATCSDTYNTPRDLNLELKSAKQQLNQEDLRSGNQSNTSSSGCGTVDKYKISSKEVKLSPRQQYGVNFLNEKILDQNDVLLQAHEMCPCGCGDLQDKCKKSCQELIPSPREKCGEQFTNKQVDTQTDKLLNKNENCHCGCGGEKGKCKRTCNEVKASSREQCVKQSTNKQIDKQTDLPINEAQDYESMGRENCQQSTDQQKDAQTDVPFIENEKCLCGCGGMKNSCTKSCKELKMPYTEQCGTQSTNMQFNTETDTSCDQSVKCPCGCDGTKDKCKKNCKELDLSSREKCNTYVMKPVDKETDIQTDLPLNDSAKCPCGCGGSKNNCKNSCRELKPSPRSPERKQNGSCKKLKTLLRSPERKQTEPRVQKSYEKLPSSVKSVYRTEEEPNLVSNYNDVRFDENIGNINVPVKKVDSGDQTDIRSSDEGPKSTIESEQTDVLPDRILNMIQNITKKFTKKDIDKSKRKKCFKEIMTVLNYLLETDESTDPREDKNNTCDSTSTDDSAKKVPETKSVEKVAKTLVDKEVQLSSDEAKIQPSTIDSSDLPTSTDIPGTSSHSSTCKVLNKIKKECERYHQKRCKIHSGKKCDGTSTTSVNCEQCKRTHHCSCRNHKCKCKSYRKPNDKLKKSAIAYNLILQTSESMMSDGPGPTSINKNRTLKNIIIKVPKKKPNNSVPFREMAAKFERLLSGVSTKDARSTRSRSLPNESEISSMEEIIRKSQGATVREYLEKNRPDFIENCSHRQNCLRYITESRADERAIKRNLLSMYLAQLPDVTDLDTDELLNLAKDLGRHLRQKQSAPKFISEREMKKHSEKIYKSLPEVVQKKEEKKKENVKKTNLLMAEMFKRNLQKKTLQGSVNLSNYSTVIKM